MSVIPLRPGKLLIGDVQKGKPIQLGRVVSSAAMFHGFMHNIQVQIAEIIFEMPIAVAMTTAILPIFGRKEVDVIVDTIGALLAYSGALLGYHFPAIKLQKST